MCFETWYVFCEFGNPFFVTVACVVILINNIHFKAHIVHSNAKLFDKVFARLFLLLL